MRRVMTTVRDLRIWVDEMTSGWDSRTDADEAQIVTEIQAMDHPPWGTDWSEWLEALPDLTTLG